jgi:hypothetical protein
VRLILSESLFSNLDRRIQIQYYLAFKRIVEGTRIGGHQRIPTQYRLEQRNGFLSARFRKELVDHTANRLRADTRFSAHSMSALPEGPATNGGRFRAKAAVGKKLPWPAFYAPEAAAGFL